jgi:putative Holliday junction resolvase
MRILGVDIGERRVGLAISDPSGTIARPMTTLTVEGRTDAVDRVVDQVMRLRSEEDGLSAIVVGIPTRLDGAATEETPHAMAFIDALKTRTSLPVVGESERLTSRTAESRLAARERDWRKRRKKLDAAAAAIILQDYLDRQSP